MSKSEQQKLQRRVQDLETEIAMLENRIKMIEVQLDAIPIDPVRVQKLGGEYTRLQSELDERMHEWSSIAENMPD